MSTSDTRQRQSSPANGQWDLDGQTVVVIGGSSGIGLETARLARMGGAEVVITGLDEGRVQRAATEVDAARSAAFDATNFDELARFFTALPTPLDHVLVTGPGPSYPSWNDIDAIRREVDVHLMLPLQVARNASPLMRAAGTLLFMSGTYGRRATTGYPAMSAITAELPALARSLAVEIAPVRVNVIAAGFVDTPLSAKLLGDGLDARREELRRTLPIRRVIEAEDIARLAVHLMVNTAITGATIDIDGGQQLVNE
jgi:NAD(P)-dependent dehydrogenase (short-subunit alcohol dehydrogenase family)